MKEQKDTCLRCGSPVSAGSTKCAACGTPVVEQGVQTAPFVAQPNNPAADAAEQSGMLSSLYSSPLAPPSSFSAAPGPAKTKGKPAFESAPARQSEPGEAEKQTPPPAEYPVSSSYTAGTPAAERSAETHPGEIYPAKNGTEPPPPPVSQTPVMDAQPTNLSHTEGTMPENTVAEPLEDRETLLSRPSYAGVPEDAAPSPATKPGIEIQPPPGVFGGSMPPAAPSPAAGGPKAHNSFPAPPFPHPLASSTNIENDLLDTAPIPAEKPARREVDEKIFEKRRRWPIILSISLVVLLAASFIFYFFVQNSINTGRQAAYNRLLNTICLSQMPMEAAQYRESLVEFQESYPGEIDADLETLVAVCETYEATAKSEEKYTTMMEQLTALKQSSVQQIANCADVLLVAVSQDYNQFLLSPYVGGSASIDGVSNISEMPLLVEGVAQIEEANGESGFSFTALNSSDKTVAYIEVVLFCYDENGNDIIGKNGFSWELVYDMVTLAPGEKHTPETHDFWKFKNCSNVKIGVPFINYVLFSDGSQYGFPSQDQPTSAEFLDKLELFKYSCDQQAKEYAASNASQADESDSASVSQTNTAILPNPRKAYQHIPKKP